MNINTYKSQHPMGTEVEGKVLNVQVFGVFVELDEEITGIIRIPELHEKCDARNFPSRYPKVGETITASIISYDGNGQVSLTQHEKK